MQSLCPIRAYLTIPWLLPRLLDSHVLDQDQAARRDVSEHLVHLAVIHTTSSADGEVHPDERSGLPSGSWIDAVEVQTQVTGNGGG